MTIFDLPPNIIQYDEQGNERCWDQLTCDTIYSRAVMVRADYWSAPKLRYLYSLFGPGGIDVNRCPGCYQQIDKPSNSMLVICNCGARTVRTDIIMYGASLPAFEDKTDII